MAPLPLSSMSVLLSLFLFLSTTSASILSITIPPSTVLPNPHSLPASTHATLTTISPSPSPSQSQWLLKARLTRSSTLVFPSLPSTSASYLLDIHARDVVFAPYRVDVGSDGTVLGVWETFRGQAWGNKGPEKAGAPGSAVAGAGKDVVVEARVLGARRFYEERSKFSPMSLFKNPMILLGVFALGVTFGMPYLMDNLDPELREEFQKQRSGRGAAAGGGEGAAPAPQALPGAGFDLAGWMAGTSPGPMDAASPATTSAREGGGQTSSSARRR